MSAHTDHAKRTGIAVPCTAAHVNFGGSCLNCGFDPNDRDSLRAELDAAVGLLREMRSHVRVISTGAVNVDPEMTPCTVDVDAFLTAHDARKRSALRRAERGGE